MLYGPSFLALVLYLGISLMLKNNEAGKIHRYPPAADIQSISAKFESDYECLCCAAP
jgi:hypothetical protein